jgi:hypothetical protein
MQIFLFDNPTHSKYTHYAFLTVLPPHIIVSDFMRCFGGAKRVTPANIVESMLVNFPKTKEKIGNSIYILHVASLSVYCRDFVCNLSQK